MGVETAAPPPSPSLHTPGTRALGELDSIRLVRASDMRKPRGPRTRSDYGSFEPAPYHDRRLASRDGLDHQKPPIGKDLHRQPEPGGDGRWAGRRGGRRRSGVGLNSTPSCASCMTRYYHRGPVRFRLCDGEHVCVCRVVRIAWFSGLLRYDHGHPSITQCRTSASLPWPILSSYPLSDGGIGKRGRSGLKDTPPVAACSPAMGIQVLSALSSPPQTKMENLG